MSARSGRGGILTVLCGRYAVYCLVIVLAGLMPVASSQPSFAQSQQRQIQRPLAVALIRDAMAAVNHANWTGNYTVLRDFASPNFATANDATRLASIFEPVRKERLDLLPAMILDPVLTRGVFTPEGRLRLSGYFPSQPRQIRFDMLFEVIGNRWRLFGVSVAGRDPQPKQAAPAANPAVANPSGSGTAKQPGKKAAKPENSSVGVPKVRPKP